MLKRIGLFMFLIPALVVAEPLDTVVAVVNDGVITNTELKAQVEVLRQQMAAKHVQIPSEKALRKQVLQHLIDIDLQLQMAKQHDLTVDSTELNEAINRIATANHFTLTQLRDALAKEGLSWDSYRENIRKELLISRLQQKAVGNTITITPQQVEDYLKSAQNQDKSKFTYQLQNIVIPLPEEPTTEQVSKAQRKAKDLLVKIKKGQDFTNIAIMESSGEFALEGGDLGMRHLAELPDIFATQVANMKPGDIRGPLRTGNGFQLIKLVAVASNDEKHEVIKTHVRHILLKQDVHMTTYEAQKQADNLYQQLKSGKDFSHMAKQYSLDSASAVKGGDLGWVTSGELVPEFEKTMDSLALNQISKPVKSMFGWHIIQVLERKKVDDSSAYQRQQVMQYLQQRKFTEAVHSWQQHIRTDAYIKIMDKDLA